MISGGAQQKLNAEAAAGYRVADFAVTGSKSADVTLEKSATPPQIYQYLLLHALMAGNLQKGLNKAAEDGYRLRPHTLSPFGGMGLIMEKSPEPSKTRYQYRVHLTLRVSSAQRNVEEDQGKGYALVDTAELMNQHVVILEKAVEKGE